MTPFSLSPFDPTRGRSVAAATILISCLVLPATAESSEKLTVELEVGSVWQSRNDVQIPNDANGTRFSLDDVAGGGPWPIGRLNLVWNVKEKHGVRALLAPLSLSETGSLDTTVDFAGQTFASGIPTDAEYTFNSWRVTYRYRFHRSTSWTWWLGGTAKVRDAEIELRQGETSARDTDVGFVPLLYVAGEWRFAERWRAMMDVDALAGGPGRAIDLGLAVGFDVTDRWTLAARYRTVEGGADTDEIYAFAWFHAAVFSGIYRF